MVRKLSSATIKAMQRVCENVTLFDVDIYFDDKYAEIVIYHNCELEINRTCVNTLAQLEDVLCVWQREYEQFVFDYAEAERSERAISQQVNDIKIKLEYDMAAYYLEDDSLDFDLAWQRLTKAEDLYWLQWQECN